MAIRVNDPNKAWIQRPLRQLYSHTASQAADCLLDPNWNRAVDIFPGMVMMQKATASSGAGDVVTLIDATGNPFGLCGVYIAPVYGIDEPRDSGVNSIPVWVLSEQSEFEVHSPSFDDQETWTFPTDGTPLYVHAYTGAGGSDAGVLAPAGVSNITDLPVARAVSRPSTNRLIIRGLSATDAVSLQS